MRSSPAEIEASRRAWEQRRAAHASEIAKLSRVLVYLEAITGVFYMAIVVASLVGARRSHPES